MWVFLTDAALSIVADPEIPDNLLVRSRFEGDIESVFPFMKADRTDGDYPFQKSIERDVVAAAISQRLRAIDYDSLRESVQDDERHETYFQIWAALRSRQRP
jgi:hypothetical protein